MVEFDDEWASAPQWAAMYRALGLQVVPAHEPREGGHWKRPFGDWLEFQDGLAPDAVFARWYDPASGEHRNRRNMGIVCGLASGRLLVIDLDTEKPGSLAAGWWLGLLEAHANGMAPETWAQRTGGGGRQVFFRAPEGWAPPTFKAPGMCVDVRGQGGFVMAPPSMHASGQVYDWEPHGQPWAVELADAPEWLIEAVETLRLEHGGSEGGRVGTAHEGETLDAWGRSVDDREHKLQAAAWAMVVDLRRESAVLPSGAALEAEILRVWGNYRLSTKSRLSGPQYEGLDNDALLEREGRGLGELRRKVGYALKRWETKVAEAARSARPNPSPSWGERLNDDFAADPARLAEPGSPEAAGDELELIAAFEGEPPEREWLVPDWLAAGVVNSLYGGGGTGKSLLALQLAASVSLGERWLGLQTTRAPVLGMFCEDDVDELHRRMWSIKAGMGYVIGWPFADLKLACRVGHENRLAVADRQGNIGTGPAYLGLRRSVESVNPGLLILDTLADVYGANEIAREQVNWFLKTLLTGLIVGQRERGHKLTVLLIGHPSDAGRQEGGKGYSGSGAWEAGVRSRLYLQKPENAGPDERVLTRGKANYSSAGDDTAMRLTWADGMFRAERELEEDDPNLIGLKLKVVRAIRNAWDLGLPFTQQRGHRRNVYVKLPRDLSDEAPASIRQAVRELLEAGKVGPGKTHGLGGLKIYD